MAIDIFSPQISEVSHDMRGKSLLIWGGNNLGKTLNLTSLPKPCYLAFEDGINAISGVPFFPMRRWADFVSFVKQLTDEKNQARAREMYQTIICDTVDVMSVLCETYICQKFGISILADKRKDDDYGFSAYQELSKEFRRQLSLLTSVGFTVCFIGHETERTIKDKDKRTGIVDQYTKLYPKGDKRIVDMLVDTVDFVGYVHSNGVDETGRVIPSSIYFNDTRDYKARSRFSYMTPFIPVFSADNLTKAIAEAVAADEKATGRKSVSFDEQAATKKVDELPPVDELKKQIEVIAHQLYDAKVERDEKGQENHPRMAEYRNVVDSIWGVDKSVSDATQEQAQILMLILDDLKKIQI